MLRKKSDAIQDNEIQRLAAIFHALSSPLRLQILFYLLDGEHCACEFPVIITASQPNTSRHLNILRKAKLIKYRREGQKIIYALTNPELILRIKNTILEKEE